MAWILQILFHVDHIIVERRLCLGARHINGLRQLFLFANNPHPAPTAASGGFDDNRVTDPGCQPAILLMVIVQRSIGTRYARHSGLLHCLNSRDLIPHQANGFRFRADKHKS